VKIKFAVYHILVNAIDMDFGRLQTGCRGVNLDKDMPGPHFFAPAFQHFEEMKAILGFENRRNFARFEPECYCRKFFDKSVPRVEAQIATIRSRSTILRI